MPTAAGCFCGADQYLCADGGKCLAKNKMCDQVNNCPARDDESSCREWRLALCSVLFKQYLFHM